MIVGRLSTFAEETIRPAETIAKWDQDGNRTEGGCDVQVTDEMAAEFERITNWTPIVSSDGTDTWDHRRLQAWVDKFGLEPREADAEPDADDEASAELHKTLESPMLTHQRIVEAALERCFRIAKECDEVQAMSESILGIRALLADLGVLKVKA